MRKVTLSASEIAPCQGKCAESNERCAPINLPDKDRSARKLPDVEQYCGKSVSVLALVSAVKSMLGLVLETHSCNACTYFSLP